MVQAKVTAPRVAIWIVEYSLHKTVPLIWKADGVALDGYYGFGDSNARFSEGKKIILLSPHTRSVQDITVSLCHFSREGFKWLIEGIESLPEQPFLLAGDLALKIVFDGYVQVGQPQEIVDIDEPYGRFHSVATKNWFGVMQVEDNQKLHLLAFSSQKEKILAEQDVWSPEYDCLLGTLKVI